MKLMKHKFSLVGLWAFFAAVLLPLQAKAIVLLPPCTKDGNCGISDILVVFVNVAEFLLGISGAVALLFFIYGGFTMLTSAGRPTEVEKGKTILRNAVIGIAIIFTSGIIVRFTTNALTGDKGSLIPTVGESCKPAGKGNVGGIYLSIPGGFKKGEPETIIPEGVVCVPKEISEELGAPCKELNNILDERSRTEKYACLDVSGDGKTKDADGKIAPAVTTCVRGLCSKQGSNIACCLRK